MTILDTNKDLKDLGYEAPLPPSESTGMAELDIYSSIIPTESLPDLEGDTLIEVYGFDTVDRSFINVYHILKSKYSDTSEWYTKEPVPGFTEGYTAVFDPSTNKWNVVEDNRGMLVYHTLTGEQICIDYLGPIKEEHLGTPNLII